MINSAMKAYKLVAESSLTGRQADAACFALLIQQLREAADCVDPKKRADALMNHQRLWSMIIKANSLDSGVTDLDDRTLFVSLGTQVQDYAIRALLDTSLSLDPLIDIASNVLDGLMVEESKEQKTDDGQNSASLVL